MTYRYRRLGRQDVAELRSLLRIFAEAFAEPDTYLGSPPTDGFLAELLGRQTFIALAAFAGAGAGDHEAGDGTAGSEVVGGLAAYELQKFEQERSEIYIYDLAVAESHRRRGVATGLINELRKIARDRGAWVIFVQADPEDDAAVKLYESFGPREAVYHFDIPV